MKKITLVLFSILFGTTTIYSQQTKSHMTNSEIVEKFLNGFNDPTLIQESLNLLSDNYQFQNPMTKTTSKAEFIELAQVIGQVLTGVEILRLAESNEWVSAQYIFKSSIPGVEKNNATEWFRIENGIIQESNLIYDASEWRKVYANME